MKKLYFGSILMLGALFCGCSDDDVNPADLPLPVVPEQPAASTTMIYEANPRFFATTNSINAINDRLDVIKGMGADVLWIMPVCDPGQEKSIGSPYCIRDFKAMNPKYGTVADLKSLVDNAHSKGMKVILDWIANHTAWDCNWIKTNPEWYTQDAGGNIISPEGMGWNDVADLNFDNNDMRAAMIDAMLYWINATGIDGFRCDYADGVPADFWDQAISQIRTVKPDAIMLAEGKGSELYNAGFDMTYDWSYNTALQKFFNSKGTFKDLVKVSKEQLATVPSEKSILRYAVNHDVIAENAPSTLFASKDAVVPAQVLATMLGGTPLLYSGQEAGFTGKTSFMNANPLKWNDDLVNTYSLLAKAYKASAKARGGSLSVYETGRVATFSYTNGDASVLVFVNATGADMTVKTPIAFARENMTDALTDAVVTMPYSVTVPAYGFQIYIK